MGDVSFLQQQHCFSAFAFSSSVAAVTTRSFTALFQNGQLYYLYLYSLSHYNFGHSRFTLFRLCCWHSLFSDFLSHYFLQVSMLQVIIAVVLSQQYHLL